MSEVVKKNSSTRHWVFNKLSRQLIIVAGIIFCLIASWTALINVIATPSVVYDDNTDTAHIKAVSLGHQATYQTQFLVSLSDLKPIQKIEVQANRVVAYQEGDVKTNLAEVTEAGGNNFKGHKLSCDLHQGIETSDNILCSAIFYAGQPGIEIMGSRLKPESLESSIIRLTRTTSLNGTSMAIGLAILLMFSPIYHLISARRKIVARWSVVCLSSILLSSVHFPFFISLTAIVFLGYHLRYLLDYLGVQKNRQNISIVILLISFMLLFKNYKAIFFLQFEEFGALTFILPIGISYILIRMIDVQLRWGRRELKNLSFRDYSFYLFFPPTFIAGPIEPIKSFFKNRLRSISGADVTYGLSRILIGLFKKLILVNSLLFFLLFENGVINGGLWHHVISLGTIEPQMIFFFCLLAYLYAYLDFSAYSDIAIGCARMYGIVIGENFNLPILATNLNNFWKRWHISLANWSFNNIYFPTLIVTKSTAVSLMLTFSLIGIWHELTLNWFTWGVYHGLGLIFLTKIFSKRSHRVYFGVMGKIAWKFLGVITTNLFVMSGFSFVFIYNIELAFQTFLIFWKSVALVMLHAISLGYYL